MILLMLLFCLVPFCYCAPEEEIIKAEVAPSLGDWKSMDKNSVRVMNMVNLLEKSYNKKSQSLYWSKFVSVKEASVQVTNWINYQITVIVEPTGCLKEEDLETCTTPSSDEIKGEKCHYFLVERPPIFKLLVIGKTCEQL